MLICIPIHSPPPTFSTTYRRSPVAFNVPHALALAQEKNLLCVADRENSRVQCFRASSGEFVRSIKPQEMGRVYSVAYSSYDGEENAKK